jgi:metal-responsive CopG/Arc/MetJ family transcriptional regulator
MANIKTAISIGKPLFDEVETLTQKMKVSRSHFFTLAATAFIQNLNNQKLLEEINAAYIDSPDSEEENLRAQMKSKHSRLVKDQWK